VILGHKYTGYALCSTFVSTTPCAKLKTEKYSGPLRFHDKQVLPYKMSLQLAQNYDVTHPYFPGLWYSLPLEKFQSNLLLYVKLGCLAARSY